MAAHHICSGLWVVGRSHKRTPEEVVAQDIAPFKVFGWEPEFEYKVDHQRRMVTVTAPGTPPRTAKYNGDQGTTILPPGEKDVYYPWSSRRRHAALALRRCRGNRAYPRGRGRRGRGRCPRLGDGARGTEHPRFPGGVRWKDYRRTLRTRLDEGHAAYRLVARHEHHGGARRRVGRAWTPRDRSAGSTSGSEITKVSIASRFAGSGAESIFLKTSPQTSV